MRKGLTVAGSLIYVGTHAITPGKLDVAKEVSRELGAFLEANHPDPPGRGFLGVAYGTGP